MRAERIVRVAVKRAALWHLLANTERLNRDLNLPAVSYTFQPREEGGSFLEGNARFGPLAIRYAEEPYCWVQPAHWSVVRRPHNGPVRLYRVGVRLTAVGAATEATAWCEAEPRGIGGVTVAHQIVASSVAGLVRTITAYADYLQRHSTTPHPRPAISPPSSAVVERLQRQGLSAARAAELVQFLLTAPPEEVVHFRPTALAQHWGVARSEALHTCLNGVQAGALELHWRLICPVCLGPGEAATSLDALARGDAHCPSCNIRYDRTFDENVEVCFTAAPAVRPTQEGAATYCIGGPHRSRHVVLQWFVQPGERVSLTLELEPGEYRLRSPQAVVSPLVRVAGSGQSHLAFTEGRWEGDDLVATGTWELVNDASYPVLLKVEQPELADPIVTAAEVTALAAFRRHFGSEVLSPGRELAVRQLAFLFTDLKGSTTLYAQRGDAPSYAAVRDHFAFLEATIEPFQGSIVKTMGDAVMAVFADPVAAVRAAVAVQRAAPHQPDPLPIKIGIHAGPVLAVSANGMLDYFGQVVNVAARVQSLSDGEDIVVTAELAGDPQLEPLLATLQQERFQAVLRGTDQPQALIRLRLGDG